MFRHVSTILCRFFCEGCIYHLATSFVAICQLGNMQGPSPLKVPNHFHNRNFDALLSPEASLQVWGVCLLLLISWYRSRYRTASLQASFPKTFLPEAFWSLLIGGSASCSFSLFCTLPTEAKREKGRETGGEREREKESVRKG